VLVRQDLSPGQQVVQACHAVAESVSSFPSSENARPHLVVCGVPNELALRQTLERILGHGVRCRSFLEPDLEHQMTAWATEPISGTARRLFRRFRLLNPAAVVSGPRADRRQ
jgi:hypothetical protein